MSTIPSIISIRPRAPLKKKRDLRYMNQDDTSIHTNKSAELKLPSLSPNSSAKNLSKPYPVTKISLVAPSKDPSTLLSFVSNSQFRPTKLFSNISNVSLKRIKDSHLNLSRRSQSPFFTKNSELSLSEILGAPKQLHLKSSINNSISLEKLAKNNKSP
jgi:hypothetical protein